MLDNPDVQAHMAAADRAEQTGDNTGRAAAASAALDAMKAALHPVPSATPANAVEASQRLDHLNKSAEWRAKFFAGDTATVNEFNALNAKIAAADPVELAIAGVVPPAEVDENAGAVAGGRELVEGAKHLREFGFTDGNIGE